MKHPQNFDLNNVKISTVVLQAGGNGDLAISVDLNLVNPEDTSIYLCGNSLGLMPKAVRTHVDRHLKAWAEMLVSFPVGYKWLVLLLGP